MLKKLMSKKTTKLAASVGVATAMMIASGGAMAVTGSLAPSTADYNFTYDNKYKGTATRTLTNSGKTWNYKMDAKAVGIASATQRSTFLLNGNDVIPTTASTSYKLFGMGNTHNMKFSNSGKSVVSTYRGKTYNLSSANRAFDDLSLETQIRQDLLNGKFTGNYIMVKKDKVESTPFRKSGITKVTVPAGTFDTVRIDRIHDDSNRSTSFWFAPSLDYLLVKAIQNDDSKRMEMQLTKVR